jgi:hypothetical protein
MRKFEDLSDKTFGKLHVLHRTDNQITSSGRINVMYKCQCECGNITVVRASSLKNGGVKSCGCSRKESLKGVNLEDLSNQRFGRWTVLYRTDSVIEPSGKKATMWHCRCDCGTEKDLRAHSLKSGTTLSCGCLKSERLSVDRDLSDQTFGRWYVEYRVDGVYKYNRRVKMWHCKCECGTVRDVSEQALLSGKSVSCGCYRKERQAKAATYEDLTGRVFGYWTVLRRVDDRFYPGGGRAMMWECECICHQKHIVAGNMLKSGISKSCGCKAQPYMESYVRQYLDDKGIMHEVQKTYDDLLGVGNGKLSYDFLIYKDDKPYMFIECQGEQHYRPVKWFGGEARFDIQKKHDKLKKDYAVSLNIPLLEIKYTYDTQDKITKYLDSHI